MHSSKRDWESVYNFINKGSYFVLTTHVNPDGDAIGSEMAIYYYLQNIGKKAIILNCSPTPKYYRFLDPHNKIQQFCKEQHLEQLSAADSCIILDVSDWSRLRDVGLALKETHLPTVCIDHHVYSDTVGEIQIMDEEASSTGEMLFDFFKETGIPLDQNIADSLYSCILTDTGSFRFSNTTPHAHRVAAELIEKGADFRGVYREVYESYSVGRMRLIGQVWNNMHFEFNDKLAWFSVTQEMLQKSGISRSEIEGFSELPRIVEGVEINLFFLELDNGKIKVSLRSKGIFSILKVAQKFNGGGHKYAAGAVIDGPLESAQNQILTEIRHLFNEQ